MLTHDIRCVSIPSKSHSARSFAEKITYLTNNNDIAFSNFPQPPASSEPHLSLVVLCAAAGRGHVSVLKWQCERGAKLHAKCMASAARGGHVSAMEWMRARGCEWDASVCLEAAHGNQLDALKVK